MVAQPIDTSGPLSGLAKIQGRAEAAFPRFQLLLPGFPYAGSWRVCCCQRNIGIEPPASLVVDRYARPDPDGKNCHRESDLECIDYDRNDDRLRRVPDGVAPWPHEDNH